MKYSEKEGQMTMIKKLSVFLGHISHLLQQVPFVKYYMPSELDVTLAPVFQPYPSDRFHSRANQYMIGVGVYQEEAISIHLLPNRVEPPYNWLVRKLTYCHLPYVHDKVVKQILLLAHLFQCDKLSSQLKKGLLVSNVVRLDRCPGCGLRLQSLESSFLREYDNGGVPIQSELEQDQIPECQVSQQYSLSSNSIQ